ncbi:MAG: hypothetical protein JW730_18930 [Anaerolineales bacterium]|nr:hypothetical protein [Anaerolineales bacterium]
MSDFLTNLVARSFAPAPDVLRPKLPSLFEAPAGGEPVLSESPGINTHEETLEAVPLSPAVRRSRLERYSAPENVHAATPQAEPISEAPERYRAAAQTILPFVPDEAARTTVKMQSEEHVSAVQTVRAEAAPDERKQADGPRSEALTQSARENDKSESVQESAARLVPVIPKLESPHSIPQTENNMDAKIFPFEDRSPTVRISIGRIEVRAVTQPSPPARASTPQRPKMTLDEYLLRRNEGKR